MHKQDPLHVNVHGLVLIQLRYLHHTCKRTNTCPIQVVALQLNGTLRFKDESGSRKAFRVGIIY